MTDMRVPERDYTVDGKRYFFMQNSNWGNDCSKCAFKGRASDCALAPCEGGYFLAPGSFVPTDTPGELPTTKTMVGGEHYLKAIQPWDIILAWGLGFFRGNIIKYVLRCIQKNGVEDLKKARHYLDYCIENYDQLKKDNLL